MRSGDSGAVYRIGRGGEAPERKQARYHKRYGPALGAELYRAKEPGKGGQGGSALGAA